MDYVEKVVEKGSTFTSTLLKVNDSTIVKKIFDNIVWVLIVMATIILLYIVYALQKTFNIGNKIRIIENSYSEFNNFVNLDTKSESGKEEKFDEINPSKHTLCDVYIISSANSYLAGRKLFDFCSIDMVLNNIKYGARYIEIDIIQNKKEEIIVAYGIKDGNWVLTLNHIEIDSFCKQLGKKMFNKDYFINDKDPLIMYLNIQVPKNQMNTIYQYFYQNFKNHLLSEDYNVLGDKNVLDLPLDQLYKKVIFICQGKIADTDMTKLANLKLGNRVKRITYDELKQTDENKSIAFNKNNLTIVEQNFSIKCLNANPRLAFNKGCQIIAMNFQRVDSYMIEYLKMFYGKSYQLKPFEFTKFSDTQVQGYDKDKIAFYYNENEYENIVTDLTDNLGEKKTEEKCCTLILDSEMNLHFPSSTRIELQNSVNQMITKIKQLEGKVEQKIIDIANLGVNNQINFETIKNFMDNNYIKITDENVNSIYKNMLDNNYDLNEIIPFPSSSNSDDNFYHYKYYVLYKYLIKILRKLLEEERKRQFTDKDFQDICFGKDSNDCANQKLCNYIKNNSEEKCKPKTSNTPYNHLCLPKHEINRENCCGEDEYSNLGLRTLYHQIHTQKNFSGKWSSAKGIIEIPDKFDETCEFKFITNHDSKEFSMFIVNSDGKYISIRDVDDSEKINLTKYNSDTDKIRAKGTFVDKKLKDLEDKNNLPNLPFHGFCDIKMNSNIENTPQLPDIIFRGYKTKNELGTQIKSCQYVINEDEEISNTTKNVKNNDAFIGIYKYSDNVYDINAEEGSVKQIYTTYLNSIYNTEEEDNFNLEDKTLYIGSDIEYDERKRRCYKMISADCNNDLQKFFKREIKTVFNEIPDSPNIKQEFNKINNDFIEDVFTEAPAIQENFTGGKDYETPVEKNQKYVDYFKINYKDNDYCLGTDFNNIIKCDNTEKQTDCKPNKLYVGKCTQPQETIKENDSFHFQVKKINKKQQIMERKNPPLEVEESKKRTCEELEQYSKDKIKEIDELNAKQPDDVFSIGYETEVGVYYLDKKKHTTKKFENEFKLEKIKDKYLIKGYNDPYIDFTPSDCSSELKTGKCLSMIPYCKGDMEKEYNSSFSQTDDREYIYKLNDASEFGNVGFVECDQNDEKQLWDINTIKKDKIPYPNIKLCSKKKDVSNAGSCIEEWERDGMKMKKIKSCEGDNSDAPSE